MDSTHGLNPARTQSGTPTQPEARVGLEPTGLVYFTYFIFVFSKAALAACGGSQARGLIGAVAACLHHSHSNVGSKLHLQPTPQLSATPDP